VSWEVFIDSAYMVALIDPGDSYAAEARVLTAALSSQRHRLVVTDAVFVEVLNYVCRTRYRQDTAELISGIRQDPAWEVVHATSPLIQSAEERYRRHHDKSWSMTDCLSMEVMTQRGILEVATTDRGFAQAGFKVLL
jgi:predicted nucleic acid-binding protein